MKNKLSKVLYILSLVLMPVLVFADDLSDLGVWEALLMHLGLTLHTAGFLCLPASLMFGTDSASQKKIFWKVFWGRAAIVLILNFVATELTVILDVASIFIGGFIGFPLSGVISSKRSKNNIGSVATLGEAIKEEVVKCSKCGNVIEAGHAFCTACGLKVPVSVASVSAIKDNGLSLPSASQGNALKAANIFGYNMTEEQMVEEIIKREIDKTGETANISIAGVERRKNIFAIIYAIILMICISLCFFHSNIPLVIVVLLVVTITYFGISKNYNLMKYLKKEVKSRPDEKIGYIVSTVLAGKVSAGSSKAVRMAVMLIAIAIPLFIFRAPHVIYEKDTTLDGYVIRFYTIGWLENDTTLEIPAEYKGEDVVGIRGDVFANVYTLEKVVLPDTIKEIRGGAFKNATSLQEINLPEGITEIKGETFQNCYSLKEITIPDSVTRIGGHAFRDNSSLAKVNIGPNSQLKEIGSSAFRDCYDLDEIYLPRDVNINEKAFKDSGTNVKEYTADGVILEDMYLYKREVYLDKVGAIGEINTINDEAIIKSGTLKLVDVTGKYGNYIFTITFIGEGKSQTFILYRGKDTYKINNNLLITIDDDYIFDSYSSRVTLMAYYN